MQKKFTIHHLNKRKPLHVKGHAVKGEGVEWKETEMLRHENANRLQRETAIENHYTVKSGI